MRPIKITEWKYLDSLSAEVKHAFTIDSTWMAIDGKKPSGYAGTVRWANDPEKLAKLRECKVCLNLIHTYNGKPELSADEQGSEDQPLDSQPAVHDVEA